MNQSDAEAYARAAAAMKSAGISLGEAAESFRKLGLAAKELERQMKAFAVAQNKELIERLRAYYDMEGFDDWDVLVVTNGTLGRAIIELKMAWRDFWREFWK
jgi:hypothetical protein